MASTVLGISAFYHDAAAALVRAGEIVAAAQEERFSRVKNDPRFPRRAIDYCLEEAFLEADELDAVVFYDQPLLTWDRVVRTSAAAGEAGAAQFVEAGRSILGTKLWVRDRIERELGGLGRRGELLVTEHHVAHAASAFYPSPFREAAIITLDGVGEWATTTIGAGAGDRLELAWQIDYPHSLGLLYSAFTHYCGFKVNSGEYKLMGLAPYGRPRYRDRILEHLIDLRPDGSYRLNTEYLGYVGGLTMTNEAFHALFGGGPRDPRARITRRHMDLAASIQDVLQEAVLRIARHARRETGLPNLVMAGGVALNCVANGLILRAGIFDGLWIQPAAGDAGGALGAALYAAHNELGAARQPTGTGDGQKNSLLGPAYSGAEVRAFLDRHDYPYSVVADRQQRAALVGAALATGEVVGFFNGRLEFGPRSLGGRSILGNPLLPDTQARMNLKIKYRESFRPFAPAVLLEEASEYFELDRESPYMLLAAPVRAARRLPQEAMDTDDMLALVNQPRSDIPSVTHVDYSARIQTVRREMQPDFHAVIAAFRERTGYGVIVNTSFNVRGEPIVCTPDDAYRCFMNTGMDMLVLEDCVLRKEQQPPAPVLPLPDDDDASYAARRTSDAGDDAAERRLAELFRKLLITGGLPAPAGAEPDAASWWARRAADAGGIMVLAAWTEPAQLAEAMAESWDAAGADGSPALAELAAELAALAFALRSDDEPPPHVDPFVYAMF